MLRKSRRPEPEDLPWGPEAEPDQVLHGRDMTPLLEEPESAAVAAEWNKTPTMMTYTRNTYTAEAMAEKLRAESWGSFYLGGKAIVLYNRRGYAPVVECPGCGGHYSCPSCGVGMVYKRQKRRIDCHYCGFHRRFEHLVLVTHAGGVFD